MERFAYETPVPAIDSYVSERDMMQDGRKVTGARAPIKHGFSPGPKRTDTSVSRWQYPLL
jgi:hypothetical protein